MTKAKRLKCRWLDFCMNCCRSPKTHELNGNLGVFGEWICDPKANYCQYCEACKGKPRWDERRGK